MSGAGVGDGTFLVGSGDDPLKRLGRKEKVTSVGSLEPGFANGEAILAGTGAANGVEKGPLWIDPLADENEVPLKMGDPVDFGDFGQAFGLVQEFDVGEDILERGSEGSDAREVFPDLAKDPGVADSGAPDHQAIGSGFLKDFSGTGGGGNVPISVDRAWHGLDRLTDQIVADGCPVAVCHSAPVDGEEVETKLREGLEQLGKVVGVFEPGAHFHRKGAWDSISKPGDHFDGFPGMAEETAACVAFIDFWGGAAEVQVDSGHGILEEADGSLVEEGKLVTQDLSVNGLSSLVLGD